MPRGIAAVTWSKFAVLEGAKVDGVALTFALAPRSSQETEVIDLYLSLDAGTGTFGCKSPKRFAYVQVTTGDTLGAQHGVAYEGIEGDPACSVTLTRLEAVGGVVEGRARGALRHRTAAETGTVEVDLQFRVRREL